MATNSHGKLRPTLMWGMQSGEEEEKDVLDSELVPSSLSPIVPILAAAKRVKKDNPRVAFLCCLHALEKAHELDPTSAGPGVHEFKTHMLHRLDLEKVKIECMLATDDAGEIQLYYQRYYEKNLRNREHTRKLEEIAQDFQTAAVLYEVLKATVPPWKLDAETERYAKDVDERKRQYEIYNILPLYAVGVKPAIMEFPEIKVAIHALHNVDNLPVPRVRSTPDFSSENSAMHMQGFKSNNDILDCLSSIFGFQEGNVVNQREHLILLLANMDRRNKKTEHHSERQTTNFMQLDSTTTERLMDQIFDNYYSWCKYLRCKQNLRLLDRCDKQQLELIYIALYLLIWGEASNIRFMPECLCYIFHHMANEVYEILNGNLYSSLSATYQPAARDKEHFLREVISPIYQVLREEVKRGNEVKGSYSRWRNYDDLNEYFWSEECLKLGWPMDTTVDFFKNSDGKPANKRNLKTNFVEIRTFWHLFRSFYRMWTFFILAFQAMVIVAWRPSQSIAALFDDNVFRHVLSIFITSAFLNLLKATLDVILICTAWRSLKLSQKLRHVLKLGVAAMWAVVLPIGYSSSVQNPTGLVKFFSSWGGDWRNQSFYTYAVVLYLTSDVLAALMFLLPCLRRQMERSNRRVITLLMWWAQPQLYVGRGMHEDMFTLLKYTLFWILLIICKLAFSYHFEILPLVGPTKSILKTQTPIDYYQWHEFLPHAHIGVVIVIWAPIVLVYFMDTQIWYAIFSTLFGGIQGACNHLGEIRTLGTLRLRFKAITDAFNRQLMPSATKDAEREDRKEDSLLEPKHIAYFSHVWNGFIHSMREEDLISNRDRDLLLAPHSSSGVTVTQWPPFLLASKIPIALDMAKGFKGKDDDELFKKIKTDGYMLSAVVECYQTARGIILNLLEDERDQRFLNNLCYELEDSITEKTFLKRFKMSRLPQLSEKLEKFLNLLLANRQNVSESQITHVLQDIMEIITPDIMVGNHEITESVSLGHTVKEEGRFEKLHIQMMEDKSWREKVFRLHLLFTVKESAIDVPQNLEARRRITFFANSLFMNMQSAPKVSEMLSFSVLTPFFKEEVIYSKVELERENEDGISTLFYLQKIYPDEWTNFQERIKDIIKSPEVKEMEKDKMELTRHWASCRGQTLSRTVRGMMYYWEVLKLQYYLEFPDDASHGYHNFKEVGASLNHAQALADLKFTYVVSCQVYGNQKKSDNTKERNCYLDIQELLLKYPSLRVAYIDETERTVDGRTEKLYFSVLVKGRDKLDEEIYRIRLPGPPIEVGEGKPENQNHAIIFTRGEALQTIDMNQDNYFEEAFKMRNVLKEFLEPRRCQQKPTILGLREHIFTGSVSSLARFMSDQETSFVTIGQRVLANPLRVRFHYGHPDIFDRIFHITRGGISKASRGINLSEDIFAGFNSTLRGGFVTHHEYIQVGKGRDVGMNQISHFEAKVANGNGEQTLSRDVYRLGLQFDFYRMLSFYFTTVGFYFNCMLTVLTVYIFLYGRLYMVLSGVETGILHTRGIQQGKALEEALANQSVFQMGSLVVLPMVMEICLEKGFRIALCDFIIMQLQLASVFFTFQLGTKAHYFGRSILHGGSKYRATGRGFVVFHAKFADNYRMYTRSHFVKGQELLILLTVYQVYDKSNHTKLHMFITFSMWFLVASWLLAPFVFNPSGFDWQKTVEDWTDWKRWMENRGGIGIPADKSWESWWNEEQKHMKYTNKRGRVLETILAFRFFIYQYGIVYHLDISHRNKSIQVYAFSWLALVTVLLVSKMVSVGRRRFPTHLLLVVRILKVLLVLLVSLTFHECGVTLSDLFYALLAFAPTVWGLLLIAQAYKKFFEWVRLWESVKEVARAYEYIMGLIIITPVVLLSWFPFISEFQTRLLFNQAFSRGLQISMILAGRKDKTS